MRCKISNYNNSELTLFVCLLAIKTIKYAISFQKKKEKKKVSPNVVIKHKTYLFIILFNIQMTYVFCDSCIYTIKQC